MTIVKERTDLKNLEPTTLIVDILERQDIVTVDPGS